ncbi:MAG: hypothetical protein U1E39_06520 [Planctomycetota bacterium]
MPVSAPVRAYYAARIFALSTRTSVPPNFRPLEAPVSGKSSVEGCAGGGKNILEVSVRLVDGRIDDVRASCGLCNPAMYVAADLVCEGARGRTAADVLALDVLAPASLDPFFAALAAAGAGRPAGRRAREAAVRAAGAAAGGAGGAGRAGPPAAGRPAAARRGRGRRVGSRGSETSPVYLPSTPCPYGSTTRSRVAWRSSTRRTLRG